MIDRVTVDDVVCAGGCPMGIRRWFREREGQLPPGMTMRRFLDEGMAIEEAEAIGDPFLDRAIALKRERVDEFK